MKQRECLIAALIFFVISFASPGCSWAAPTVFARMTNPNGVAVDQAGNVYVQSLSALGDGGLFKFDSNGVLKARNSQLFGDFRLEPDPLNGVIWAQEIQGKLYVVDPNTLQASLFMDMRTWATNNNPQSVLDMLTGKSETLWMFSPHFGDIAMHQVGTEQFDLFITGLTSDSGGMPFVLRLRIDLKNKTLQTKNIVASIPLPNPIVPPPLDIHPFGIAVNGSGTVLTALLDNISGGTTPPFLATFGSDFPETGASTPMFVPGYRNRPAFTMGMTASPSNGGFYVATVANGFGCGAGPAILYFTPSLDKATCIADLSSLGLGNVQPDDIALDTNNRFIYVTMTQLVLRLDLPTPPPSAANQLLTVITVGNGTVTSSPPGINCGSDCNENYANGKVVTLTATPSSGSAFTGWGGACSGTGACQVTMNAATSVTTNFAVTQTSNVDCIFSWAEKNYPSLFAPSMSPTQFWTVYTYRYYSATNAYLAVNSINNHVYYMGPDGSLQDEGPLSYWSPQAGCQVPPPPSTECLFNWAEKNFPALFAPSDSAWGVSSINWTYRYYKVTNAYLEVNSIDVNLTNNHVFYTGADGQPQDEGPLSYWLPKSGCQ